MGSAVYHRSHHQWLTHFNGKGYCFDEPMGGFEHYNFPIISLDALGLSYKAYHVQKLEHLYVISVC